MLLVGSKALKCYNSKYICPKVKRHWDTDIICTYDEFQKFEQSIIGGKKIIKTNGDKNIALLTKEKGIFDFEIALDGSSGLDLINLVKEHALGKLVDRSLNMHAVNPDVVFTLKKSHRFLKNSPHFMKTMLDYKYLRDECGCKIPEALSEFYKKREKETYNYSHPKLNVSKKEFFADIYKHDHDSIHEAVKHLDHPAYWYFKEEKAEVKCSKLLFEAQPDQVKIYSGLEEAYVLALERSIIPSGIWSNKKAFMFALEKLSSSISSGWYRNFIYERFDDIASQYNDNYVNRFNKALDEGIVKPFVKNNT